MASPEILRRIAAGRTDLALDLPLEAVLLASPESDGHSPLVLCAHFGDATALKVLLERGAPTSALGPNLGLMGAAFHNHWRLVQFLIEMGANPNLADDETGETALHAAVSGGGGAAQYHTVKALLLAGADPAAKARDGRETGCFMRDVRTRGETPLHRAAAYADGETIDLLLDAGAPRDAADAQGDSPLSWGSWARRPDVILRRLCFGPHRINPHRKPMSESLVGDAAPQ